MDKKIQAAQLELQQFRLPMGYSEKNVNDSKYYLERILFLLKYTYENKKENISNLIIDLIGKIANVQGWEIIVVKTDEPLTNQNSVITCGNGISSIILWENEPNKTINDLIRFIEMPQSFLPEKKNQKKYYFHNESVIVTEKKLVKTK